MCTALCICEGRHESSRGRVIDIFLVGFAAFGLVEWLDFLGARISSKGWDTTLTFLLLWTGSPTALALALLFIRNLARRWVVGSLIAADSTAYREAWLELAAGAAGAETAKDADATWTIGLHNVEAAATALVQPGPSPVVIQRLRRHRKSVTERIQLSAMKSKTGQGGECSSSTDFETDSRDNDDWCRWPPAASIDQLFGQATVASIFLRHKARVWAMASDGSFWAVPAADPTEPARLLRWAKIAAEPGEWRVRWTGRKRVGRALEKLQRAYGGDPSRLGDICRECIVLDGLEGVVRCLEAIKADPEARVVRVKNRLGPSGDEPLLGGYRYGNP